MNETIQDCIEAEEKVITSTRSSKKEVYISKLKIFWYKFLFYNYKAFPYTIIAALVVLMLLIFLEITIIYF